MLRPFVHSVPSVEVVRARVVRQRHLDVVAESEAGAPRQFARVPRRRERRPSRRTAASASPRCSTCRCPAAREGRTASRAAGTRDSVAWPFWIARCVASSSGKRTVDAACTAFGVDAVELRNLDPTDQRPRNARCARSLPSSADRASRRCPPRLGACQLPDGSSRA